MIIRLNVDFPPRLASIPQKFDIILILAAHNGMYAPVI